MYKDMQIKTIVLWKDISVRNSGMYNADHFFLWQVHS